MSAPVSVMETAGEGGAWGIAVLASYLVNKDGNETLEDFLDTKVFAGNQGSTLNPDPEGSRGLQHVYGKIHERPFYRACSCGF